MAGPEMMQSPISGYIQFYGCISEPFQSAFSPYNDSSLTVISFQNFPGFDIEFPADSLHCIPARPMFERAGQSRKIMGYAVIVRSSPDYG